MFNKKNSKFCLVISTASVLLMGVLSVIAAPGDKNYVDAGNVSVSWKLNQFLANYPQNGRLTNLTFRFTVNENTLRASGTYFAQQFFFDNPGTEGNIGGYTGLQPRPDQDGKQYLRAVFSTFIAKSKSTDENCHDGADGGPGVSCSVLFPATYGHTYKILVHKISEHTWRGEVEDEQSGKKLHIGSWTLPDHVGDIKPSGNGFSEYYAYYERGYPQFVVPSCDKLAEISVIYGPVSTTNYGGGVGSIYNPYEYNSKVCKSQTSNYSAKAITTKIKFSEDKELTANGQEIRRGWVSKK